jgi:hypothetical protein
LLRLTTQVFATALTAYEAVVSTVLEPLRGRMQFAVSLPARLTGVLHYRRGAQGPGLEWFLEALPESAPSSVDIKLNGDSVGDDYGELRQLSVRLRTARPEAASWIGAVVHQEALHIFDQTPASQIVMKWINDDLKRIGWI